MQKNLEGNKSMDLPASVKITVYSLKNLLDRISTKLV